mgnify:CR=1 FL=1
MLRMFGAAIAAGALLTAATAVQAETAPRQHTAVSVENYAVQAAYRTPAAEKRNEFGYSASTRRIADCLATYPGYDPKIDRVRMNNGVTRACRL